MSQCALTSSHMRKREGEYLIIPPVTLPLTGSCHCLKRSWTSSSLWVTSAPKIIVDLSLTKGMRRESASTSTVFLPPTLTLIFKATFARYYLLILKTCLVKQHCETSPRSVSQIRSRSPTQNKINLISMKGKQILKQSMKNYHKVIHYNSN